jgi:hydrogenase nickel incorporation protein HypA/HybF
MHELSIVAALFETINEQARENRAGRVTGVTLRIGRLSGVVPELLESAFDMYKKGTIAETAKLTVDVVPLRVRCRACGEERGVESYVFVCAACASPDLEILEGTEMILERIELETDDNPREGSGQT